MRMQPDFEKANEIYFRLGIIYKQQTKYNQSLEVRRPPFFLLTLLCVLLIVSVLQIYSRKSAQAADRRGYMVSDWSCSRAAKRCQPTISAEKASH